MSFLLEAPLFVHELNEKLNIEQSLLSQHLKILRNFGLVCTEREGKQIKYSVSEKYKKNGRSIDFGCCELNFK